MKSLWDALAAPGAAISGQFHGRLACFALASLLDGSTLGSDFERYRGRSILIVTDDQLPAAVALIELDGIARRVILATTDVTDAHLAALVAGGAADTLLTDQSVASRTNALPIESFTIQALVHGKVERRVSERTEWILLTSGTTGMPKLVVHTLDSLAGTLPRRSHDAERMVWSTFYDIRRYGGLQIYLRAVLSGASLVLSSPAEPMREFLSRAARAGVTHISGTPSHWRKLLMSGDGGLFNPRYVRLSGEVADQALLDSLRATYPAAKIAHAFASTEAGVAFDVNDGLAGFPASLIDAHHGTEDGGIEMRVTDGTLRIRSRRIAAGYLQVHSQALIDGDGFVDTGDLVELIDDRYYFRGRRGGVINVGGLKVYPEEVEAVLNSDARVRMSLVHGRRSPITGAIVVADVVLADPSQPEVDPSLAERIKSDLLCACRRTLAPHKVPAMLRWVPALELSAAGKLVRPSK